MRKPLILLIIYVFMPIVLGTAFYYLFCPDVFFVIFIDGLFGMNGYHIYMSLNNSLLRFLRYYLMDFLWAFALLSFILIVFNRENKKILVFLVIIFEVLLEMLQLKQGVLGTFDICDICIELLANILVIYLLKKEIKNEEI